MRSPPTEPLLRDRHGHAPVTNEELFFDLIYAFAVTQLSHHLLEHLGLLGAVQSLVLWFAVWLGWQYTAWVTNWFNPRHRGVRLMLFGLMLLGLLMAAAIPDAFGAHGLQFALSYAALQLGRGLYAVWALRAGTPLRANFVRILGWLAIAAVLWTAGGVLQGAARLALWSAAVACEYLSPMLGFWLPRLGRSATSDWTVDGAHLAERCQLFVIVALGESILDTGAGFSAASHAGAPAVVALFVAFCGSLALWWIYFDTSVEHGRRLITQSRDPGRIGARFFYVHVTLIAGVIVCAVADDVMVHQPDARTDATSVAVLVGGPLVYLLGNAAYKFVLYGWLPPSHLFGIALLGLLGLLGGVGVFADRLTVGAAAAAALVAVAVWQSLSAPQLPQLEHGAPP